MVQLAFDARVDGLMGQLLVSEKLVTREPVIEILLIVTELGPTLLTVIICGGVDVPLVSVPKFRLVGEKLITVPVPVRAMVCGLLGALSVTFTAPDCVPDRVGVKTTLMVQLAFAPKLAGQLLVWE